jgi:hypothetical protein
MVLIPVPEVPHPSSAYRAYPSMDKLAILEGQSFGWSSWRLEFSIFPPSREQCWFCAASGHMQNLFFHNCMLTITTRNPTYAECRRLCRVQNIEHLAKLLFAECLPKSTRQTDDTRRNKSLPSAGHVALGKAKLCRVPKAGHSANPTLSSAMWPALGKQRHVRRKRPHTPVTTESPSRPLLFAECPQGDTRQTPLCRVPRSGHSAKTIMCAAHKRYPVATLLPWTLRRCEDHYHWHSAKFYECRVQLPWHSAFRPLCRVSSLALGEITKKISPMQSKLFS